MSTRGKIWDSHPFMRGLTFGGSMGLMIGGALITLWVPALGVAAGIFGTFIFAFMLGEDSREV